ncbi:hypothetical protein [Geomicrobium sp. JCM 19055]|uniref:hypothetical protein n=1 Tax=Geomicrobium sp. JCM 19055 TaxID=1460649 RepID=UPI000694E0FD|nr:hypothetical protein [Geomicrobium sp. JCM 19055]
MSLLLLLSAAAMSIYGFTNNDLLLAWFPFLGIFIASTQMFYWWRGSKFRRSWVVEHITGMLSCGISTVTAFVVFGAPRLFSLDEAPLWLWFAPTVILVPLIIYFTTLEYRKASRKKGAKKAAL